jgi:hypothetical protein
MKRIKLAAVENDRSINAEIAARVEGSFEISDAERRRLREALTQALAILDKGASK